MMQTETLDRLYLEWSQFTKAKTRRELELEKAIEAAYGALWHDTSKTSEQARFARGVLMLLLTNEGRERGIAAAISTFGQPAPSDPAIGKAEAP